MLAKLVMGVAEVAKNMGVVRIVAEECVEAGDGFSVAVEFEEGVAAFVVEVAGLGF